MMKRYTGLRSALRAAMAAVMLLLAACLVLVSCTSGDRTKEPKQPNIIVILSDDIGYSDIGSYGSEISTPNLDRLAAEGVRFTNFYNTARCSPSRATLLTGLYPHQAAMGHLATRPLWDESGYLDDLNRDAATVAEVLREAGYSTYMTGKWHLYGMNNASTPEELSADKSNWPIQRGFDRFFGNLSGSCSYWDPFTLLSNNTFIPPGEGFYYTDAISDTAVKFIREHPDGKPFFFYVAYYAAHWPLHAPEEAIEKYSGVYDIGWDSLRVLRFNRQQELGVVTPAHRLSERTETIIPWKDEPMKEWQARRMETYAAMIDIMDQGIGRIIAALEEKGELDNTVILYMQDNGGCAEPVLTNRMARPLTEEQKILKPMPADQVLQVRKPTHTRDGRFIRTGRGVMAGPADSWLGYGEEWANVSNTPFRLYKSLVHEGGISTPLIVHWPEGIEKKGAVIREAGHLIDIMPTCLELAGAGYPGKFNGTKTTPPEGVSLLPALDGEKLDREFLFWEHEASRAIRMGKWKLVARAATPMYFTPDDEERWELYDLENDPSETTDLAAEQPERVKKMAARWEEEALRITAKPWPWDNPGR
ncbi:MAG: arylsulfatase [Bacteroidales bacterium]|jgi:arylsulfatase|nr:arylsulfatase [Bacteroidales bacterium]